jgi:type 1 glutamine amidotransferase
MNLRYGWLMAALMLLGSVAFAAEKTKVLVVTGGHGFDQKSFFEVFKSNPNIEFTHAEHKKDADVYDRADLFDYKAIVLYDMPQSITDSQKERFLELFKKGIGLVVLHHALVSYQNWPDYERVIGGRYVEPGPRAGMITEAAGYQHDVEVPVVIVAKDHPVTKGLSDFTIHDEIYWGFRVSADSKPLITTTQPKSGKPLGWTRTEGKSKIVFIQLGHGPEAHSNENYRKLVAQSIAFVAGK